MHIPWTWAKQRPQFLAQELNETFDILVAYKKPFIGKNQSSEITDLALLPIRMLPYNAKSGMIRFFNKILTRLRVTKTISSCKYIWITSPDLFDLLSGLSDDQVLIYDCMDDMLSFSGVKNFPRTLKYYHFAERKILERANIVICSSNNLKAKLIKRYNVKQEIFIVNNGLSESLVQPSDNSISRIIKRDDKKINIIYVGTISKWMDWELILKSLELNDTILYHFVGPLETDIPKHERIVSYGVQPHKEIKGVMADADILFMPFHVTELIESVNPVKLYEYIYSGKPAISVRYNETELFEDFVYLYLNLEEYMQLIKTIQINLYLPKRGPKESLIFCRNNTWAVRGNQVKHILENNK